MASFFTIFALVACTYLWQVALAQDDTFIGELLSALDSLGVTNFTDMARLVQEDSTQPTFFLSLSDSSTPKTLFVPNNNAFLEPNTNSFGYPYIANDTAHLASLLLYHLVPGTWLAEDLGTGQNHTVIPTTLQGRDRSFLENDEPQVIALGNSANGIEIYNQYQTTAVLNTYIFQHVTIHVLNEIIGIPGPYSFGANFMGLNQFEMLQNISGIPDLDNQDGLTVFAPSDNALIAAKAQVASSSLSTIFANHVIYGRTVWYPDFQSDNYTSASGHNFTFTLTPSLGYTVTLNSITANIVRSDFLTNNGVIHIIDSVFWNTTEESLVAAPTVSSTSSTTSTSISSTFASTSTVSSSPTSTTSARPSISSNGVVSSTSERSKLSPGTIVGIVGVVALAMALPVIAFLVWRYRRAKQGSKIISGQRRSIFDLPSPALRTTPFYLNSPSSKPGDSEANLVSDVIFTRGSVSGTSSTASPVSQTQPRIIQEKPRVAGVDYQPISPNSDGSSRDPQASTVPRFQPQLQVAPVPTTAEVVEHVLQEIAQRMDHFPPARRASEAPPRYPASCFSR